MRTVGVSEAKTRFSELLKEVAGDATVEITKRGTPIGRLEPIRDKYADAAAAIEELKRFREEHHITLGEGLTIRELIEEGRE